MTSRIAPRETPEPSEGRITMKQSQTQPKEGARENGRADGSFIRAMISGAWRFAVVSMGGFAVWAAGGKWFHAQAGEGGLYAACAVAFIALAGLLMHPLIEGSRPVRRFYGIFTPAFFAYALVWSACWFALGYGTGEWLGLLGGSAAFIALTRWRMKSRRPLLAAVLILFAAQSAGYFIGGKLMHFIASPAGAELMGALSKAQRGLIAKLAWGAIYGLGFGAGLGWAFHFFQNGPAEGRKQL